MPLDILDLLAEAELPEPPAAVPVVSSSLRIRQNHHLLARKLAEGASDVEAAGLTGFAPSTIRRLRGDPAFQELLAYYTAQTYDLRASIDDRVGAIAASFLDELQTRLQENPDSFSNTALLKAFEALADRSIAPNKSRNAPQVQAPVAVAVHIDWAAAPAKPEPKTIDAEVK